MTISFNFTFHVSLNDSTTESVIRSEGANKSWCDSAIHKSVNSCFPLNYIIVFKAFLHRLNCHEACRTSSKHISISNLVARCLPDRQDAFSVIVCLLRLHLFSIYKSQSSLRRRHQFPLGKFVSSTSAWAISILRGSTVLPCRYDSILDPDHAWLFQICEPQSIDS